MLIYAFFFKHMIIGTLITTFQDVWNIWGWAKRCETCLRTRRPAPVLESCVAPGKFWYFYLYSVYGRNPSFGTRLIPFWQINNPHWGSKFVMSVFWKHVIGAEFKDKTRKIKIVKRKPPPPQPPLPAHERRDRAGDFFSPFRAPAQYHQHQHQHQHLPSITISISTSTLSLSASDLHCAELSQKYRSTDNRRNQK